MTSPSPAQQVSSRSSIFYWLLMLLAGLFLLLFAGLGIWQVERLQWKRDLIARVDARVHAAAVPAPGAADWQSVNVRDDEYRHVMLSGRYLHDKEVLVHALTERGSGFWVLTPLQSADGALTFINRGFVPSDRRDPSNWTELPKNGETEVRGLLRMSEPNGFFLRPNDPARNDWNSRDVAAFAVKQGLGPVAPYFIDADVGARASDLPIGGLTVVTFRNNHLSYAITWFALSAMMAAIMIFVWRHERRAEPEK